MRSWAKVGAVSMAIVALSLGGWFAWDSAAFRLLQLRKRRRAVSSVAGARATRAMPLGLPSEETAKAMLDSSIAYHHPQWIDVPMGATRIHTFVIYPTLAGTAPVVVVTGRNQGLSDWARAVGTEVVSEGYIAVVPDLLSGMGPNGGGTYSFASSEAVAAALGRMSANEIQRRTQAVRDYFVNQPGSNGKSAILDFNSDEIGSTSPSAPRRSSVSSNSISPSTPGTARWLS